MVKFHDQSQLGTEAIGDKQRLGDLQFGDTLSNKREMTPLKNQRVMYKICKSL